MNEAQQPQFPLAETPRCRRCDWEPRYRNVVSENNRNGNAGRPYYKCVRCEGRPGQGVGYHLKGWITWDDDRGMDVRNPECYCGVASRQDKAGAHTTIPNLGFWTCATGRCNYYSAAKNGQTVEQRVENPEMAEYCQFRPWLL